MVRNLGNTGYTPTPKSPPTNPQSSHPHPQHPSTVGVGVTAGVPWEADDATLPEEVGDLDLVPGKEAPDGLPY